MAEIEGRVPLTIGTTGHREIHSADTALLEQRVRAYFLRLQDEYPNTPLYLLSALAEGADRLVARVALDLRIRLIVPLPLPLDDYLDDFNTKESKNEMCELLACAARVLVVPGKGGSRNDSYARLGVWLAHHSQIVLALWDELDTERRGGTADVVRMKREGISDPNIGGQPLDPSDTGPVHVIHSRRAGDGDATDVGNERTFYPSNYGPPKVAAETFATICARTEEFNADSVKYAASSEPRRQASRRDLASASCYEAAADALAPTIDLYTYADALAVMFQTRTRTALNILFSLIFLAVLSFAFFAHEIFGDDAELPLLGMYLALFFGAFVLHGHVKNQRYEDRYLDYRALAEGLRVQFYWFVSGVTDSAADRYLTHQRYELDWIRNALRACELATAQPPALGGVGLHCTLGGWVAGQNDYFKKRVEREESMLKWIKLCVRVLVVLGITAAVAQGLLLWAGLLSPHTFIHSCFIIAIAVPTAWAALLHGYAEKRALDSHVKRYAHISVVFENARQRLAQHLKDGDADAARRLLHSLGLKALEENGDWVILHRDRPLEVPQPG